MKEKLQALILKLKAIQVKELVASFRLKTAVFTNLWNSKSNKILVRFVIVLMLLAGSAMFGGSVYFAKHILQKKHEQVQAHHDIAKVETHQSHGHDAENAEGSELDEHAEEVEGAHASGHGEHAKKDEHGASTVDSLMGQTSPYPKAITKAQDGVPEPDHDLQPPNLTETRGLASVVDLGEISTGAAHRFVDIKDIVASVRSVDDGNEAMFAIDVALEVDSLAAENEVKRRNRELYAMIAAIISNSRVEDLERPDGKNELKKKIFASLNHHLRTGRVKDVLFTNYFSK